MAELFTVLFQDGFFKIIDEKERKIFQNYCTRHKGKFGRMGVEDGFTISIDEKGVVTTSDVLNKIWGWENGKSNE